MRRAPPARRQSPAASGASPPDAAASQPPADLVAVGRIADAWGVRGALKVSPYNAAPESVLLHVPRWWLSAGQSLAIRRSRAHGESIVAEAQGVTDRDAALALKGREIFASRAEFPPSSPGEYYWVDLVGCAVVNRAGYDFGIVSAVVDHGAHPLLEIGRAGEPPRLIPFVERRVLGVDLDARRIEVDWEPDF